MSIFISYRRSSIDIVGRIQDALRKRGGEVFQDILSISPGSNFEEALYRALAGATTVLVIIGPDWLEAGDLRDPRDWVRREVEYALHRPNLRVIPVLVGGATLPDEADMPTELVPLIQRQVLLVDSGIDFEHHIERLEHAIGPSSPAKQPSPESSAVSKLVDLFDDRAYRQASLQERIRYLAWVAVIMVAAIVATWVAFALLLKIAG